MHSLSNEHGQGEESLRLENELCRFIEEELIERDSPVEPATTFEDLALDSLFMMELFLECERLSGKKIGSSVLGAAGVTSVRTLVATLNKDQESSESASSERRSV